MSEFGKYRESSRNTSEAPRQRRKGVGDISQLQTGEHSAPVLKVNITWKVRRYPLFSSPTNNIVQHEGKGGEEKMPAEISATVSKLDEDADLMHVSTLFEEQNSIETLLSEIREIDIASLVRLRTVAELNQNKNMLDRGQEEQVNDEEEEDFSLNIDLRSKPIS